jgi:hypothetical protein
LPVPRAKETSRRVHTGAKKGNLVETAVTTPAKTGQIGIQTAGRGLVRAGMRGVSERGERCYEACSAVRGVAVRLPGHAAASGGHHGFVIIAVWRNKLKK